MIKNAKIVLSVFLLFIYFKGVAQRNLSLDEALFLMRENSLEFKSIQRNARIEKVQYAIYKNSFLPRVDLNVSLPTYSRAINSITQPNGENTFIEQSQANSTFDFNISQKIPLTGGTLILNSSINRLDLISSNRTSFSSNWFNVLLNQPLNGYNIYKWGKKINKVKFDKNNIDIYKDLESLRNDLVNLFFSVYLSEKKIELTKNNINLTNEYLNISEEKLKQGRILEADVIKVRLSLNQLKSKLENDQLKYKNDVLKLKDLIGVKEQDSISLLMPDILKKPEINIDILQDRLQRFTLDYGYDLALLESERDLDKAKKNKGIQIELQIAYGLNSNSDNFDDLYSIPSRREYVNFGLRIPILNWGENDNRYTIQKLVNDGLKENYKQNKRKLKIRAANILNNIESAYLQIKYTNENRKLAIINLEGSYEQLKLDRLTIYDFKRELFEEEKTFIEYVNNVKTLWITKFILRETTLYDFFLKEPLFRE